MGIVVWVVGQIVENGVSSDEWELGGVYTEESLAVSACRTDQYFIGPATLDKPFPYERSLWKGSYYPKHGMSKEDQIRSNEESISHNR